MEKSRSYPSYPSSSSSSSSNCYSGLGSCDDGSNSYNFNGPRSSGFATAGDPDTKRKKRVASYNSFAVEGKLKASVRSSFKWIKNKFDDFRQ